MTQSKRAAETLDDSMSELQGAVTFEELQELDRNATQNLLYASQPVFSAGDQAYDCAVFFVEPSGQRQIIAECFGRSAEDATHPSKENAEFIAALVNFWRSGGREMVREGLALRRMKELALDNNRLMAELIEKHAARRTSGDERG